MCRARPTYRLAAALGAARSERRQLIGALRGNAESDRAILMDRRDTSFAGTSDDVTDEEVIFAIKSVPCHY